MAKRIYWIDHLKALEIFFMILGHHKINPQII